jgi:hypothetical protein
MIQPNSREHITMKLTCFLFLLLLTTSALAQEETLLGSGEIDNGGYGALVVKLSSVNNHFAVLAGARGGWIINHTFCIGLGGYGLVNNVWANSVGLFGQEFVNLGYGGLDLEFIVNSNGLLHASFHTLLGAGAVGLRNSSEYPWDNFYDQNSYYRYDTFFVLEPGINLDLNVTTWMRVSIGAEYRHVSGLSSGVTTNTDLSTPSGTLAFRFGSF